MSASHLTAVTLTITRQRFIPDVRPEKFSRVEDEKIMHMYKRPGAKGFRDSPSHVHKQTNTPSDFAMCSLCEEKFTPKLSAHSCLSDQERNIKEYSNALSYINSCHSIINHMMMQNKDFKDTYVHMPNIPNFMDLFSVLLTHGWESKKKEKQQAKSCEPHLLRNKNLPEGELRQSTESENSDFEHDVIQHASKLPMQKFKSKLPRTDDTIYEEDIPNPKPQKRQNTSVVKPNQRKTSPTGPRGKRYSDIISPPVQDGTNRKVKQRSYSAVSPRSKSGFNENKSGPDLSANYSDTVLTANSGNKNDDLSQQDLDKFAKELLGSGSNSPIHSPRSSSPDNRSNNSPTPSDKSPTRVGKKPSKPGTPPNQVTRKYSELLKKNYTADRSPSPSQDGIKSPMRNPSEATMLPTQITLQAKKTKSKPPSQKLTPERPGTPTVKMSSANNYVYSAMQPPKEKAFNSEDNPYAMQQYIQLAMKRNEQQEEDENYEKQDVYDGRKPLKGTPSKCSQFAVKIKSKEGFHSGRKLSAADMKIIESQVQLFVEHHMESDEGKTDSDIEEDKKHQVEDRQIRGEDRKNFRGPRKQSESDDEEQVVKFTEAVPAYQRIHQPANPPKRSQMSDESSDIKSDDDAYDHQQRPVHVHRRGTAYTSYSPTRR